MLGLFVGLLLVSGFAFKWVDQMFFPSAARAQFMLDFWAPEGTQMKGRRYYLPRHLIEDKTRGVLWLTLFDYDKDTPNDLILPQTGRSIPLNDDRFTRGGYLASVDLLPFTDDVPGKPNAQRFTFHIERTDGPCDSESTAGRAEDL